jgi:hypothetical protein
MKHVRFSAFDGEIMEQVRRAAGTPTVRLVHPSMMFRLFMTFWRRRAPYSMVAKHIRVAPLPAWDLPGGLPPLPERFVAAKLYFNQSFPDTLANRAFIRETLTDLARKQPVVLLNTGLRIDDHREYGTARIDGVISLPVLGQARDNLGLQTAVVRNATAFLGTYGGFSYLPPLYGVPTMAVYSDSSRFLWNHMEVARRSFESLAVPYLPLHARDAGAFGMLTQSRRVAPPVARAVGL